MAFCCTTGIVLENAAVFWSITFCSYWYGLELLMAKTPDDFPPNSRGADP
jgi:hypothetical protein